MKRICVSAGLAVLGATATQAQYAPGLSPIETAKPWTFSASVRGFYDDNYLTLPKTIPGTNGTFVKGARDSWGTEVTPSVAFNHSTSDTLISASYIYDLQWYQDKDGTTDQSHVFNASLQHEFSERYKGSVTEQFVVAQEPGVLYPGAVSTPLRVAGSNIRNTGTLDFSAQMTKLFSLHFAYNNTFYAFQENNGDEFPANSYPSYSALLDRMEQDASADLRWKALPETVGVLGYQYQHVDYTSPEDIIFSGTGPLGSPQWINGPGHYTASSRNLDAHFVYLGVDQNFTPNLSASARAGIQYLDYYNQGLTSVSPYVDASGTWQYLPQCTLQLGVKVEHNATDVAGTVGTTPVLDEESVTAYVSDTHQLTPRLTLGAMAQGQFSTFNGGGAFYNGKEEDFYVFNLNLAYHFSPWLIGELGYSYNKLNTALVERGYSRDIVYIGLRATY